MKLFLIVLAFTTFEMSDARATQSCKFVEKGMVSWLDAGTNLEMGDGEGPSDRRVGLTCRGSDGRWVVDNGGTICDAITEINLDTGITVKSACTRSGAEVFVTWPDVAQWPPETRYEYCRQYPGNPTCPKPMNSVIRGELIFHFAEEANPVLQVRNRVPVPIGLSPYQPALSIPTRKISPF